MFSPPRRHQLGLTGAVGVKHLQPPEATCTGAPQRSVPWALSILFLEVKRQAPAPPPTSLYWSWKALISPLLRDIWKLGRREMFPATVAEGIERPVAQHLAERKWRSR